MSRSVFAIIIGVLSCIAYITVSGLTIGDLIYLMKHESQVNNYGTVLAMMCVSLIYFFAMSLISVLMTVGVKKRCPHLISPWVTLGAIGIVCSILHFFIVGIQQPTRELLASLVFIGVSCLVWYPIFTLWRDMRNGSFPINQEQSEYQPPPGYYAPPPIYPSVEENRDEYLPVSTQKE